MFKHKIFDLLRTFSEEEIKRFNDFIKSPYFNKSQKVLLLYKEIIRYYPSFSRERLSKKILYKDIFNSKGYKDSSLRNLLADLLNLAKKFLVTENSRNEKFDINNQLLEELLLRNQNELFFANVKKVDEELKNSKKVDFGYLFNRYKLERNKFNYSISNDKIIKKGKIYTHIEQLSNSGTYLTIYYITEIICEYLNMIVYSEKFNAEHLSDFFNKILKVFDIREVNNFIKEKNECDFVLNLYIALYTAFSDFNRIENYYSYKNLLNEYSSKLSKDELSFHYSALISYCILKEKSKGYRTNLSNELLNLYVIVLENEYYRNRRVVYLPAPLFRDILFLEIRLKRLDLVKELLTEYISKIDPKEKHDLLNFGYAFYSYETGVFEKSLDYIGKIKLNYFIYKYDVKNLMLKVYFEMNYYEEALSLIHTYKEFLRNDNFLSDIRKLRHKNYIKFLEKMVLYKSGTLKDDINFVKGKLLKTKAISYKKWLVEKVNELVI